METAFAEAINDSRFIPYIQLHEFEALLFCGIDYLAKRYPGCEKRCEQLKKDLEKTSNPELINNSPETAPSKRIIKAIEGDKKQHYNYNKPATGKDLDKAVCSRKAGEAPKQTVDFDEMMAKSNKIGRASCRERV